MSPQIQPSLLSDLSTQQLTCERRVDAAQFISAFSDLAAQCATEVTASTRQQYSALFAELMNAEAIDWQLHQRILLVHVLDALRRVHDASYIAGEAAGKVSKGENVGLYVEQTHGPTGRYVATAAADGNRSIRRTQLPFLELKFNQS